MVRQPNIVFILMDDLGWKDLGCYGSDFYETPHLDLLAQRGMRFTDAYAACPVCSPTRASILTGKYPARVGVTNWIGGKTKGRLIDAPYIDHLPLQEKSLATALRAGGYATWHVGKWHLGKKEYWPEHHGFEVNIGGCEAGSPRGSYFSPHKLPNLSDGPEGEYLTDRLTDEAIKLIRNRDERPFYLNFCHYAVHTPIQAKPEDVPKYELKARMLGRDKINPMEVGAYFPCEHKKSERIVRRTIQSDPYYAAMIQNMDWNIGRLVAALEEQGIADNTIFMFTSDNGGLSTAETSPTCNSPLSEGKGWMYEGGVREPLIVYWPGVTPADSTCMVPISSPDFYPTLLEAAGLPLDPQQHTDGESMLSLLKGGQTLKRDALFWHYPHYGNQGGTPGCSMRMGDWKLIEFFEDRRLELYNLREDVGETENRAVHEPNRVNLMHRRLIEWRSSVEAQVPQPNPEFVPWQ